nr:hypothetical protein [Tanacetum cinerariifolium]
MERCNIAQLGNNNADDNNLWETLWERGYMFSSGCLITLYVQNEANMFDKAKSTTLFALTALSLISFA